MTLLLGALSLLSLACSLASAALYFLGKVSASSYKTIFLWASVAWFVFATLWASKRKKSTRP